MESRKSPSKEISEESAVCPPSQDKTANIRVVNEVPFGDIQSFPTSETGLVPVSPASSEQKISHTGTVRKKRARKAKRKAWTAPKKKRKGVDHYKERNKLYIESNAVLKREYEILSFFNADLGLQLKNCQAENADLRNQLESLRNQFKSIKPDFSQTDGTEFIDRRLFEPNHSSVVDSNSKLILSTGLCEESNVLSDQADFNEYEEIADDEMKIAAMNRKYNFNPYNKLDQIFVDKVSSSDLKRAHAEILGKRENRDAVPLSHHNDHMGISTGRNTLKGPTLSSENCRKIREYQHEAWQQQRIPFPIKISLLEQQKLADMLNCEIYRVKTYLDNWLKNTQSLRFHSSEGQEKTSK